MSNGLVICIEMFYFVVWEPNSPKFPKIPPQR
jgi:hypothetical protein